MARSFRLEFARVLNHVTYRGDRREDVYHYDAVSSNGGYDNERPDPGILAKAGISIDAVLQREADEVGGEGATQTDLIILTHDCVEAKMNEALAQMQALMTVLAPIVRIRKEELA